MHVLDIFIGLVLIYFLYSLFVSIIAEMISTWMGMRARLLRQGIQNLIDDRKKSTNWGDFTSWIKDIFLVEPQNFRFTMAGKFYNQPEITTLAKRGDWVFYSLRNTKPSYISSSTYTKTIISMLTYKSQGVSLWDQVIFSIENNTLNLDKNTLEKFRNQLKKSDGQYTLFIEYLEEEYDEMMNRINGWYKRKIGLMIFWLGLLVCLAFRVDSIRIAKILSQNEGIRAEMVNYAEKVANKGYTAPDNASEEGIQTREKTYAEVKNMLDSTQLILGLGWKFENEISNYSIKCLKDSATRKNFKALIKNTLLLQKKTTLGQIELNNTAMPNVREQIKDTLDMNLQNLQKNYQLIAIHTLKLPVSLKSYQNEKLIYETLPGGWAKFIQIIKQAFETPLKLLGIIITALALSLGAQFWFDLLKKLVAIRGAGLKPGENKEEENPSAKRKSVDGTYIFSGDSLEIVISKNRHLWESFPGFLGYNKELKDQGQFIEVLIQNGFPLPENYLIDKVDVMFRHSSKGVLGCYFNGEDHVEKTIRQDISGIVGTVTGVVYNPRTQKNALLTCGHVARTSNNSFFERNQTPVSLCTGNQWKKIGNVTNVVMSCYADGGVIDLDDDATSTLFEQIKSYRTVTNNDKYNTTFKIWKRNQKPVPVKIISINRYFTFSDILKNDVKYFDLLMLHNVENPEQKLSDPGDSGSLITDDKDTPVGILVGGHEDGKKHYSFAIKLSDIFEILQIKTCTS